MTTDQAAVPDRVRRSLRAIPARWRIVGWMVLTTTVAFAGVGWAVRGALLADVDRTANTNVEQELAEFRTFAGEGVDPATGEPFTDPTALVQTHLQRQSPGGNEVLIGVTAEGLTVQPGERRRSITEPENTSALRALVDDLVASTATSGVLADVDGGPGRWARVAVDEGTTSTGQTTDPASTAAAATTSGSYIVVSYTDRARAQVTDTVQLISLLSLLGLLLSAGIAWLVAGQILEPVRLVRKAAAEITERDLTRRIPIQGRDDVAALSVQFNAMLDRLERAFTTQRRFVDDAGHELRTPITIVRGHLELMGDDPAERAATIRLVLHELDRMNRIVSDLLVLAKAERPDFVQPEETDVAQLTVQTVATVETLADRRWIPEQIAEGTVRLDPQRITQAVLQLAQNAVQHTEDGDEIRLGSAFEDGRLLFWVSDSGPGVREEELDTIFERFRHGSGARGRQRAGAGLGLSIVQAIVGGHGGDVAVSSRHGEGARFTISLPTDHGSPTADTAPEPHAESTARSTDVTPPTLHHPVLPPVTSDRIR